MLRNDKDRCSSVDLREWYNDEERPHDFLLLNQMAYKSNGLDGLTQTHLISQDSIQIVVIERYQPLKTFHLQDGGQRHKQNKIQS